MGQMNYVKCKVVRSYTAVIKKKIVQGQDRPWCCKHQGKESLQPPSQQTGCQGWGLGVPSPGYPVRRQRGS